MGKAMKPARLMMMLALMFGAVFTAQSGLTAESQDDVVVKSQTACDHGHAEACSNLGVMYEYGSNVKQDYSKAAGLYQKACNGGDANSCNWLGVMYHTGQGVKQDLSKSVALYRKACDGGNAQGCYDLGESYKDGTGVKKSSNEALKWLKASANLGNSQASSAVAYIESERAQALLESRRVSADKAAAGSAIKSEALQKKEDDATCKSYGASVGTEAYISCRIKLVTSRQNNSFPANTPTTVAAPPPTPIVPERQVVRGDGTPDDLTCSGYGFSPGTDSYANCRFKLDSARAENQRRQKEYEAEQARYAAEQARAKAQFEQEERARKSKCYFSMASGYGTRNALIDALTCENGGTLQAPPPPPKPPSLINCTRNGNNTTCTAN